MSAPGICPDWSLCLGYLTDAAAGEPEHVLHQPVPAGVQRHQLLLHKLLAAGGLQPRRHPAQTPAVVRAETGRGFVVVFGVHKEIVGSEDSSTFIRP